MNIGRAYDFALLNIVCARKLNKQRLFASKIQPLLMINVVVKYSLAEEYAKGEDWLYITAPCSSLCDYRNRLVLANTQFYAWTAFADKIDLHLEKRILPKSSIPPGFFEEYGSGSLSLCSKETMCTFAAKEEDLKGVARLP